MLALAPGKRVFPTALLLRNELRRSRLTAGFPGSRSAPRAGGVGETCFARVTRISTPSGAVSQCARQARLRLTIASLYRELILRVLAPMLPNKEAQEGVVRGSPLDWVLIRPPRLTVAVPATIFKCCLRASQGGLGTSSARTSLTFSSTVPPVPSTPAKRCRSGPDAEHGVQLNRWMAARLPQSRSRGCSPAAS